MADQYDGAGKTYDTFRNTAAVPIPERHTFFGLAGELGGLRVLDLACGSGTYTRALRQRGASRVVGVDISPEMIREARAQEEREPLGLEYHVADATRLQRLGEFDLVTAAYLLNYAQSREDLVRMLRGAYDNLRPGGRLLAVTVHPDFSLSRPNWTQYGVTILEQKREEGRAACSMEFHIQPPLVIRFFQWDRDVYDGAVREAGFQRSSWHGMQVPAEALAERGEAYWHTYLHNPLNVILACER